MRRNDKKNIPAFVDIVFENRNKEYGAYVLRREYDRNVLIALFSGVLLMLFCIVGPFMMSKKTQASTFDFGIKNNDPELIDPSKDIKPPEPPKPEPSVQLPKPAGYIAPVVVDSAPPENSFRNMDDLKLTVTDKKIDSTNLTAVTHEDFPEAKGDERKIFIFVEEPPQFGNGESDLMKYFSDNVRYPQLAIDNDIQGKVYVRFCVTNKGTVDMVTIVRGVNPILDEEAMRVVKSMPKWKPGKQMGKAVNVWHTVPISFKLTNR